MKKVKQILKKGIFSKAFEIIQLTTLTYTTPPRHLKVRGVDSNCNS